MRTTTREIVRVCAEIAKLDKKGKVEVLHYLQEEIERQAPAAKPVTYVEGGER